MSITLNQKRTVAQSQEFKFDEVHITGGAKGELTAVVSFVVNDENGNRIDTQVLTYKGEDFNTFWENFDSGEYLYQELVEKEELAVSIPEDIEESFVNEKVLVVEEVVEETI